MVGFDLLNEPLSIYDAGRHRAVLSQIYQAQGAQRTAELDARYVHERSLRLDLKILAYTAWINVVGKQRGRVTSI